MERDKTNYDTIYVNLLNDILRNGSSVTHGRSLSIGSEKTTLELLNYSFILQDPRDRLLLNPKRQIKLTSAVGRFFWMMSGSNRVSEIEYYDNKAKQFSDDGITIPGSSDGARLINPRPGLNQIERVIELLQNEKGTRRGVITIYFPEDVGRNSRDIPCTIALTFNLREDRLYATTLMRSNNAIGALPYDVFLYSLLAEVIASSLQVELYQYYHFAVSMHIYSNEISFAQEIASEKAPVERPVMRSMPQATALSDVKKLIHLENHLRLGYLAMNAEQIRDTYHVIISEFDSYWVDFALILLIYAVEKCYSSKEVQSMVEMGQIIRSLSDPFRTILSRQQM